MTIKKCIEKIEGEANLNFTFENDAISDVDIEFTMYRGIESILKGKDPLDALVITPRVCGICNHAHLIAAVRAIEDGYRSAGLSVDLSSKAKQLRMFTLGCELLQNHVKWFYLTLMRDFEELVEEKDVENHLLKASYLSSTITKALAIFAGQWPHSSYAVPGGVTCDPTHIELMQAESYLDESINFLETVMLNMSLESFLEIKSVSSLHKIKGDIGLFISRMRKSDMLKTGSSHDRFIVFGDSLISNTGKVIGTKISSVDPKYIKEINQEKSTANALLYKDKLYEVGPLSRAMLRKEEIVKNLHKAYGDSLITRIFSRIHELVLIAHELKNILRVIELNEPSFVPVENIDPKISFNSFGIVEAARGSLVHSVAVEGGKIAKYGIYTPTQWNLSNGIEEEKGIAQSAMIGIKNRNIAEFIFKSFDLCSVCTTK